MFDLFSTALVLSLAAISGFFPGVGALGLLFGFGLADRHFALLNTHALTRIPIFITEPTLAVLLGGAVYSLVKNGATAKFVHWKSPWWWFLAIGLINLILGLISSHPIMVFRDSAIVYYSLFMPITYVLTRNAQNIRAVFFVITAALLLRFTLSFFMPVFGDSTASVMYESMIILTAFCAYPTLKSERFLLSLVSVLFLYLIIVSMIRTAWVGFFLAFLTMAFVFFKLRLRLQPLVHLGLLVAVSIPLTVFVLNSTDKKTAAALRAEAYSFVQGVNSPNLMTRIAMWVDSIEEIIPASGKLFRAFDREILNPFLFGQKERPAGVTGVASRSPNKRKDLSGLSSSNPSAPSATSIIESFVQPNVSNSDSVKDISSPPVSQNAKGDAPSPAGRVFRAFFGVPFGTSFVPKRISFVHAPNRYDPHNSIIAIFYRTGIIGFALFAIILFKETWATYSFAKTTRQEELKPIAIAVIIAIVYHIGHSLTDVTLENPFKGGIYWMLLGLMMALREMDPSRKKVEP